MECLGVEPGAAWWKAQTNPLSYGSTPMKLFTASEIVTAPLIMSKVFTGGPQDVTPKSLRV